MAEAHGKDVDRFAERLEAALGKNLVAAVLYGSAARGTYVKGRSDLNVCSSSCATRRPRRCVPRRAALADWTKAGEPAPLVFSEAEWRASADVFPIEVEDMAAGAPACSAGATSSTGLTTSRADLRRELEREVAREAAAAQDRVRRGGPVGPGPTSTVSSRPPQTRVSSTKRTRRSIAST